MYYLLFFMLNGADKLFVAYYTNNTINLIIYWKLSWVNINKISTYINIVVN